MMSLNYVTDGQGRGSTFRVCHALYTLGPEKIRPVNKTSTDFAQFLLNHLLFRKVMYLIGKPCYSASMSQKDRGCGSEPIVFHSCYIPH